MEQQYLGVQDAVDGAGRGEVEDAVAAAPGGEHGGTVEEVAREEADAGLVMKLSASQATKSSRDDGASRRGCG